MIQVNNFIYRNMVMKNIIIFRFFLFFEKKLKKVLHFVFKWGKIMVVSAKKCSLVGKSGVLYVYWTI